VALDKDDLSQVLWDSLGKTTDKDGNPTSPTPIMQSYANGIISMVKAATVVIPAGSVTGNGVPVNHTSPTPVPGSFEDGAADNGVIVGIVPTTLYSIFFPEVSKGVGPDHIAVVTGAVTNYCTTVATYLTTKSLVSFATGNVTGACTALQPVPPNFPGAPGALVGGTATGGVLSGLDGDELADLVKTSMGFTENMPDIRPFHRALCGYLQDETSVEFLTGTILGTFGAALYPIPLASGAGAGGIIT